MALQKQNIDILFDRAVDTSSDSKTVIASKFTRLDDFEFHDSNTIRQRPGYTQATISAHTGSVAVSRPQYLHSLRDEILLEAKSGFHGFLTDRTLNHDGLNGAARLKTFERAKLDFSEVSGSEITTVSNAIFSLDVARAASTPFECWVWAHGSAGSGAIQYRIVETSTRSVVQSGAVTSLVGGGTYTSVPRVIARDSGGITTFFIYYAHLTAAPVYSVRMKSIQVPSGGLPGALSGETVVVAAVYSAIGTVEFDAWYDSGADTIALAYQQNATGFVEVVAISGASGSTISATATDATGPAIGLSVAITNDSLDRYMLVIYSAGASTRAFSAKLDGTSGLATALEAVASSRTTLIPSPFDGTKALVFYGTVSGARTDTIRFVGCDFNGANPAGASVFAHGVRLYARPSAYTSSSVTDVAVPAFLFSNLQSTAFVLKFGGSANVAGFGAIGVHVPPRVLARVLPAECYEEISPSPRIGSLLSSAGTVALPIMRRGRPSFVGATQTPIGSVSPALVTISFPTSLQSFEAQRSLFLDGACPMFYDGAIVHEAGFNYFPEIASIAQSTSGTGQLTLLATYSYVAVYEWVDSRGVRWRSDASVPVSFTLTGGNETLTLTVPYLKLTDKSDVRIQFYRTTGNGTVFFRCATLTVNPNGVANVTTVSAVLSFVDSLADTAIQSNEVLYTTGGGLGNEAWPSGAVSCAHQRRIFRALEQESNYIQYTDEIDDRFLAPATNEVYRLRVPAEGGRVTGLASLDDKLIIGCEHAIYYVYGDGPNRAGQQNGYSLPQVCSAKLGMKSGCANAITLTPDGLWFMGSNGGLRLLTRGLQIAMDPEDSKSYFGWESDGYFTVSFENDPRIESRVIDARDSVHWYVPAEGTVVIYNYQQRLFSRFTNFSSGGGSVSARSRFWHCTTGSSPSLFSQDTSIGGLDHDVLTSPVLETAWIRLTGLQGLQRVYSFMLLARAISGCRIQLEVGYDYNETYAADQIFNFAQASAIDPLQIEHRLTRQQCEAVRFRIAVYRQTSTPCAVVTFFDYYSGNFGPLGFGDVITAVSGGTGVLAAFTPSDVTGTLYLTSATGTFSNTTTISNNTGFEAQVDGPTLGTGLYVTTSSPPSPGDIVTGATSGVTGVVNTVVYVVDSDYVITLTGLSGTYTEGETVGWPESGEAARLTAFSLSVGVKPGLHRLAAAKRF